MTNPVLALFGHAVARKAASDQGLVERTKQEGKRWLTQQSRETRRVAEDHRKELQYGWIKCLDCHEANRPFDHSHTLPTCFTLFSLFFFGGGLTSLQASPPESPTLFGVFGLNAACQTSFARSVSHAMYC